MRCIIPLLFVLTAPALAHGQTACQGIAPDCWVLDPAPGPPDPAIFGRAGSCRQLDALSTAERQMVIEADYTVIEGGLIDMASVRLVSWSGGDEVMARQALRTLSLTVIRCSGGGSVFTPEPLRARLNGPQGVVEFLP
ncbi:MAG: hypothetical protein JG765_2574 [Cereibacter sp.]|jgi:hypothetical protein|nr:hypothetical protein [Cereibacter sp.]